VFRCSCGHGMFHVEQCRVRTFGRGMQLRAHFGTKILIQPNNLISTQLYRPLHDGRSGEGGVRQGKSDANENLMFHVEQFKVST